MKIRTGFVSNSSSSSFTLIGHEISPDEINKYDTVYFIGQYLNEGYDLFKIDEEFMNRYKDVYWKDCEFFAVKKIYDGEMIGKFTQEELQSLTTKDGILSIEADYHSEYENNIEQFEERYIDREEK